MSCIFSPFKRRQRSRFGSPEKEDDEEIVNLVKNSPRKRKEKDKDRKDREESGTTKLDFHIQTHNANSRNTNSHNTNSHHTHSQNTNSHSDTTRTTATPIPSLPGIPCEIGGMAFDSSDEVSIISFSTTFRGVNSFEKCEDGGKFSSSKIDKVKEMNEKWVNKGTSKLFEGLEDDDSQEDSDDDETKSHYTRVSI